jgi:hypothetical protein
VASKVLPQPPQPPVASQECDWDQHLLEYPEVDVPIGERVPFGDIEAISLTAASGAETGRQRHFIAPPNASCINGESPTKVHVVSVTTLPAPLAEIWSHLGFTGPGFDLDLIYFFFGASI